MCDRIIMPNGDDLWSISKDPKYKNYKFCLCLNTLKEILAWIVDNIPELQFGESLIIERSPGFGYIVEIKKEVIKLKMKNRKVKI